jgi:hypothetical protein
LSACAAKQPGKGVVQSGETFDQVLEGYARLYDREMTTAAGNEKGLRVLPMKGLKLCVGAYRPLNAVDDLSPDCCAARAQIRQYDMREYPQVDAATELEAGFVLPTSLSQGLGIVAKAAGKSISRYQVRLESPVALYLSQSEVTKLWAKPSCSSKVFKKNTTVALVRGYVYARLTAVVMTDTAVAPKVKVFEEDLFTVRYLDNGSWQISDRAAKPYMWLASTQTFGEESGAISRGEVPAPAVLVRPTEQDVQMLQRTTGRYGGEQ